MESIVATSIFFGPSRMALTLAIDCRSSWRGNTKD